MPLPGFVFASGVRPRIGELVSGDGVLSWQLGDATWVVLIDGLGHGAAAHEVVARASALGPTLPSELGTDDYVHRLHASLRGSRGAAVMALRIRGDELEGCAVGNIELRSVGARVPVVAHSGVVGSRLPVVRPFQARLLAPTRVFMFSDGISRRAPFDDLARLDCQAACDALLRNHRHDHDDSSVAVLHFG